MCGTEYVLGKGVKINMTRKHAILKKQNKKMSSSKKHTIEAYIFILPWIIGFIAFQVYPIFSSLYYSLNNYNLVASPVWVGINNYKNIFFKDAVFKQALLVTIRYVIITVPSKLIFALFIAMLLKSKIKGIGLFRTVYYLPSILGGSVGIAILWRYIFSGDGPVNLFLNIFGIPSITWIGHPNLSLVTLSMLAVWQFGSSMVIFLAALKQVPSTLYEAAMIDGAGPVRRFFKITIPMISPIILFNTIMQLIIAFQEFSAPFLITKGGPFRLTYTYSMMIYDNAFNFLKMGYSCALSWIMFVIILFFTLFVFRTSAGKVYYEDGGGTKW